MLKSGQSKGAKKHIGIIAVLLVMMLSLAMLYLGGCGDKARQSIQDGGNSQKQAAYGESGAVKSMKTDVQFSLGDADSVAWAGSKTAPVAMDRKIIQNAQISLEVKNVSAAADKIIDLNKQNGGYTVTSHMNKNNDRISAVLSIKVPQQKLNSILASIAAYGEVIDKVINTEDVTEEYYDSEARLKVLKAKEERLLSLMNKAANVSDIISIENELSNCRSEIEVLTGRLKYLSNATDYSLVDINLHQAVGGTVRTPRGTLGKAFQGLINSLNQMIHAASNLVVLLFVLLPWAFVLFLLFMLIRYLYLKKKSRVPEETE